MPRDRFVLGALLAGIGAWVAGGAAAQGCDGLAPSGGDDAPAIQSCLNTLGYATLGAGTFLIDRPIEAIGFAQGVRLIGAGKTLTKIQPRFTCGDPNFLGGGSYRIPIEVRRSPNSTLAYFHLDLEQLRESCGHGGNWAIAFNRSPGGRAIDVKVTGSHYGSADDTTGWAHGGGIYVVNSANSLIQANNIKDLGYVHGSGFSVGFSAIQVENSANTVVEDNYIRRVAFGIEIVNKSPSQGFSGDVSGSIVRRNDIGGAAQIGCPRCSHGRALKFQACGIGDELPIRNVVITDNVAANFGGQVGGDRAGQGGSGMHVTCGVQYGRFERNTFVGSPVAEMGLLIDSEFPAGTPVNPTHHNTFNYNRFESGRGSGLCNGNCADIEFNNQGPDQIGLTRYQLGTNSVKALSCGIGHCVRVRSTRGCQQFSHAWFVYPPGQSFVYRGQEITLAAAGVRPPSFFSVATFRFRDAFGNQVATYQTGRSQDNCVINQERMPIDFASFAPGRYDVFAEYWDGNADSVFIRNDRIGSLDVR